MANNGAKFRRRILGDGNPYSKGKHLEHVLLKFNFFLNAHNIFGGIYISVGKVTWGVDLSFNRPGRSEFHKVFPAQDVDAETFRQQIISLVHSFGCANFTDDENIGGFAELATNIICNGEVYGIHPPKEEEPFGVSHQQILKFVKTLTTEDIPPPPAGPDTYHQVWLVKTWGPEFGVSLFVIMHRREVSTTISVYYLVVRL